MCASGPLEGVQEALWSEAEQRVPATFVIELSDDGQTEHVAIEVDEAVEVAGHDGDMTDAHHADVDGK